MLETIQMNFKTFLCFLVYSQLFSVASSQNLVREGRQWNVRSIDGWGGVAIWTEFYKIEGETIINGEVYKNVWRTYGRDTSHFFKTGTLIREDSLNRVFRKDEHFQEEQLLYDFNKEIGDTIFYFSDGGSFSCDYLVIEIDTIELLNGQEKRKLLLESIDNRFENSFIVDGVGSSFGFLNPYEGGCIFDYNAVLMCMYEDGVQIFQNPDESICYSYRVSTTEISNSDNIKISPIPFENGLSIDLSNSPQEYQSIEIFNGEGKVYWKRDVSMNSFSIETESFPPGIYLLRLRTFKGEFKTQRILKI